MLIIQYILNRLFYYINNIKKQIWHSKISSSLEQIKMNVDKNDAMKVIVTLRNY